MSSVNLKIPHAIEHEQKMSNFTAIFLTVHRKIKYFQYLAECRHSLQWAVFIHTVDHSQPI